MYVLTNIVGTNCAVYDDSDNSVEWIQLDVLKGLLSKGIVISGADLSTNNIKPQCVKLNYKNLNWNDGKNIFQTATSVKLDNKGNLSFISGSKKYKAKMMFSSDNSAVVMLSNGIQTVLPSEVIAYLRSRK